MSRYVIYYSTRQDMYRELAARWARWSENRCLTATESAGVSLFFRQIARRFGLTNEFRDLGIIQLVL